MKNLRTLGTIVALTFVLGLFALAGETATLACGPVPGQIDTPPCATAQAPNSAETAALPVGALGQTDTPPASGDPYLTEIASSVLLSIVSLF